MLTEQQPFLVFGPNKLAVWSIILTVTLTMLVVGCAFVIPLTIAILLWSLLDALNMLTGGARGHKCLAGHDGAGLIPDNPGSAERSRYCAVKSV